MGGNMKKFSFGLLLLALSSGASYAQDYLNCGLRIADNEIDCPFFRSCHHKDLKESKSQLLVEVHEGETKNGKINLKKVLLFPGSKKEKDNRINVFIDDNRPEKIKIEKEVDLITYEIKNGINYSVSKYGDTLDIHFKTSAYNLNITLNGDGKYQDYVLTNENAISVNCEKLNKDAYDDIVSKKEALSSYEREKAILEKSKSKAKQE
jgi:hypothetical protein